MPSCVTLSDLCLPKCIYNHDQIIIPFWGLTGDTAYRDCCILLRDWLIKMLCLNICNVLLLSSLEL